METANTSLPYFDLASGHPVLPSPNLPNLAREAFTQSAMTPAMIEKLLAGFWESYFLFAHQNVGGLHTTYTTNATNGLMTAAKYLAQAGKTQIVMSDPTPKFIHDIMQSEGLNPVRMDDRSLYSEHHVPPVGAQAMFLAIPGNPSGNYPSKENFRALMQEAKARNITIIADFCFRLFSPLDAWDQYRIMQDVGVDFIAIENTGKTFDAGGQKLGLILTNNARAHTTIHDLEDLRGPISAASAKLVSSVALTDMADTPYTLPVREAVRINRAALNRALHLWQQDLVDCDIPFAVIHQRPDVYDEAIVKHMRESGLDVSPMNIYTGRQPYADVTGIRIALARKPEEFAKALNCLVEYARQVTDPETSPFKIAFQPNWRARLGM